MQVSRWGNSLAVRLPRSLVQALDLKEGDEIAIRIAGERAVEVERDRSRDGLVERLRALRKSLPPGWKSDRDEANAR